MRRCLGHALAALIDDESGQDLIEYGLLTALIGLVTVGVWIAIQGRLGNYYVSLDGDVQNLWVSPDPGGA
jgi:Flp pilus assembly pilin Flp